MSVIFLSVAALLILAGTSFAAITKNAVLDENKLTLSSDEIAVFDNADEAVKTMALGDKKLFFPVEKIPQKVKFAFIDAEDKHFYAHGGMDYLRMARAAFNNLHARSFKEGASTISQQLIKNTHLTQEKTIKRKLMELKLTGELERRYTKDEILEKYLNSIYFGHNCFGIKSAAEFYFSKSPDRLSLAEGAMLAGIVKSPNNYSPFKNAEKCRARRSATLAAMLKQKHITAQEKAAAENVALPAKSAQIAADDSYLARCYDELECIADEKSLLLKGKISIYTYLDSALQQTLSSLLSDVSAASLNCNDSRDKPDSAMSISEVKRNQTEKSDAIAAVLNNSSCGFSAYFSTCGNIARSPASLFKPLCVYAPAFEEKLLCPATPVLDEPTCINGYQPKNYGDKYYGYVSARECIAGSLNVPAVKTLNALTLEKSRAYLSRLGLPADENDFSLAAALGGVKKGYTLPQLIAAYSVFPRGGTYRSACFIRKIAIDGQCVYDAEAERARETRVFSESTAALITDVLKTCAKEGTAKKLRALPYEIAAKTGTNGDKNGNYDAYALAYTTSDTAAVWLGNADRTPVAAVGGGAPCNKLFALFSALNERGAPKPFTLPHSVVKTALDKTDYERERRLTLADDLAPEKYKIYELFDKTALPAVKSTRFSHPEIAEPKIEYNKGRVSIILPDKYPDCYEYLLEREEDGKKRTIYRGKRKDIFTDDVETGKNYEYFLTPYFKDRAGDTVALPCVSTKTGESPAPAEPPGIVDRDWWNY